MNQLTKFFEGEEIRIIEEGEQIRFVGVDVAKVLGYTNPHKAVRDHCKGVNDSFIPTTGGTQALKTIPKGDVFRLIVRSKLPSAERFEVWVFDEVLPNIQEHGGYITAQPDESSEVIMARAVLVAQETIKRLQREKQALVHSGKLYTATEIAKELGFKSANALNKMLEEQNIQYFVNKTWVLKANYADKGYTSIKQTILESGKAVYDRKWTGVGREFLINKFGTEE